jgi:hypothetical protein
MSRLERWSVWLSAILTSVTGIGLFWAKYLIDNTDPWSVVNHPFQPWLLKAHVLTAPLLIFAVGLIAVKHVWHHYREGLAWGRKSGIVTALSIVPMVLSGYLIQVVTHLGWLRAMAYAHIAFGVVFAAGLAVHQMLVRRRALANHRIVAPRADREIFAGTR